MFPPYSSKYVWAGDGVGRMVEVGSGGFVGSGVVSGSKPIASRANEAIMQRTHIPMMVPITGRMGRDLVVG